MSGVWRELWLECVHGFKGYPKGKIIVKETVTLVHDVGLQDIKINYVAFLLDSYEELSNEDLMLLEHDQAAEEETVEPEPERQLTIKLMSEAFTHIEQAM